MLRNGRVCRRTSGIFKMAVKLGQKNGASHEKKNDCNENNGVAGISKSAHRSHFLQT